MRPLRKWRILALLAASVATPAWAQTSLTGSSIALKSSGSATLSSAGYLGTYLTVPAGGATVNFTVNATEAAGSGANPHMNLVIADTTTGFNIASTSATNYSTGNITLPAGTYFVRDERDYPGNGSGSRSFTVNNLSVNTVSGSAATFSNTSTDANAFAAANTYIDNFRKGPATVTLNGPGSIPLLAGTPIHVDLARHDFNFGNAVPGTSPTGVNNYLASGGTTQQNSYQSRLNLNFNTIVPENMGKWQSDEGTRNNTGNMAGVDTILNYAQSHQMRARMHNVIWGSQQPAWVNTLITSAGGGNAADKTDLRNAITSRIDYYVGTGAAGDRARKYTELDVYNESYHTGAGLAGPNDYWHIYAASGVAGIYNEVRDTVAGYANPTKLFVNEYNVLQNNGTNYATFYMTNINQIRDAGGTVSGVGIQYYPSGTAGTGSGDGQHSPARIESTLQNLATQGASLSLNEFGVGTGGTSLNAAQIVDDSVRLMFGMPGATGFLMWGFQDEGTGNLFKAGSAFYTVSSNFSTWTITDAGKRWQDLLGIQDWDENPNNAWDTDVNLIADANGTINVSGGFYGDYYLSGQGPNSLNAKVLPFDMHLTKGTTSYNTTLAKPANWFFWKTNGSSNFATAGNWTDAPESGAAPGGAGYTAFFGSSATSYNLSTGAATTTSITNNVTVTLASSVMLGMLVFDNAHAYTLNGGAIGLQGYNNASGHVAAIYVNNGSHTINSPLTMLDNTTVTVAPAGSTLTVSNLQPNTVTLTKSGAGALAVNNVRAGTLSVSAGAVNVLPKASGGGTSKVTSVSVTPGAKLDLADNSLVTHDAIGTWDTSAYTGVLGLVASGYADGAWTGSGIVTGMTAATGANPRTTLAVATADETGYAGHAFGGVSASSGDVLVMYTYGGDANLSGSIDVDDYFQIDSNYNHSGSVFGYFRGDFNYDGTIDGDDYFIIDASYASQGSPLSPAPPAFAGLAAIPEPSALFGGVALAAGSLARRRRR